MSAWADWAREAEGSDQRWAYLYRLSYRRAEILMEEVGVTVARIEEQADLIRRLQGMLAGERRKSAELSEELEAALGELEKAEASDWSRPA